MNIIMFLFSLIYLIPSLLILALFLLVLLFIFIICLSQISYYFNNKNKNYAHDFGKEKNIKTLTFIHPDCANCGGGEKVLWKMIHTLVNMSKLKEFPSCNEIFKLPLDENFKKISTDQPEHLIINIVSGSPINFFDLCQRLYDRFNINLRDPHNLNAKKIDDINIQLEFPEIKLEAGKDFVIYIRIIPCVSYCFVKPFRFLTMLLQILGQVYFAFEIIFKIKSDVYFDTTGLPFMYPILKVFGHSRVIAYTHYPFISEDMISQIQQDVKGVHSSGFIGNLSTKFKFLKIMKVGYYKAILYLYKFMGHFTDYDFCNSSWTRNHMIDIWNSLRDNNKIKLLFPPCNKRTYGEIYTEAMNNGFSKKNIIVSFSQFRPEKRQDLQLKIFKKALDNLSPENSDWELHIIGGVRNKEDEKIAQELKKLAKSYGIENKVKFLYNASVKQVIEEFSNAKIGIHTMQDEHFGISIIEMMAAGLIVIAHNSAGAKLDIIGNESKNTCGLLANNVNEFVDILSRTMTNYNNSESDIAKIMENANKKAEFFSDEAFMQRLYHFTNDILG